jgi:hypothetical protein
MALNPRLRNFAIYVFLAMSFAGGSKLLYDRYLQRQLEENLSRQYSQLLDVASAMNNDPKASAQFEALLEYDLGGIIRKARLTLAEEKVMRFICNRTALTPSELVFLLMSESRGEHLDFVALMEKHPDKMEYIWFLEDLIKKLSQGIYFDPTINLNEVPKELKKYFEQKERIIIDIEKKEPILKRVLFSKKDPNKSKLNEALKKAEDAKAKRLRQTSLKRRL